MNAETPVLPANGTQLAIAERAVIALAVESGNADLPPITARLIAGSPDTFYDLRNAKIAACIKAMREKNIPVHANSVIERCRDEVNYILSEIAHAVLLPETTEMEGERVLAAYQLRRAQSVFHDAGQSLEAAPAQAGTIIETAIRSLADLADTFGNAASGLPDIIDAAVFISAPRDTPPELVAGILHMGSKLAFGGSSKAFKTWTLLDLGLSVAYGVPWLGFPTVQGKVLFVNFEIQPHAWQRRIAAAARAKGIELKSGAIHLWNLRGHAADFRQLIPHIIARARREGFALIILDPIYKLYGGTDENAAGAVAELLNSLERLAVETGAAVAYGCHFAKGNAAGKDAIDRISGSGVFARDPDSLLIFTKHEAKNAFTVEPILRNFPPVDPFVVRWEFPLMHPDKALDPGRLKRVTGRKPENAPEDLLPLLPPRWTHKRRFPVRSPCARNQWADVLSAPQVA
jgi:hypothetical protein